ncbi:MAG: pantoate--beta-alanine ligase [Acidimicrobiales bacterium]|jgi:pantoate--beta-alanine ligase
MIITHKPQDLRTFLDQARRAGKSVGFHPTMGALHGGHRSNIRRAAAECDVVAVSIFVNPLQFGPNEDLDSYPRDLDNDYAQAEEAGADIVLAPPTDAMFPEEPLVTVRVKHLGDVLEGIHRPGHFDGVATIVTKLFGISGPCYAYFGEKDYQQLLIVRRLVADLSFPIVIVPCSTVRQPDGLALSSRNGYLTPPELAAAPVLYWSLLAGKRAVEEQGVTSVADVRAAMVEVARQEKLFQVEYAEVVDALSLAVPPVVSTEVRLLIAGRIGKVRLIDNVAAKVGEG